MKTIIEMQKAHDEGRRISMVTAYDVWSARVLASSGVDLILVGDSVAMAVHGHSTTIAASVEMMEMHAAAVRRGAGDMLVVVDMPFLAHRKGRKSCFDAVDRLMKAGATALKIEGCDRGLETISSVVDAGVPVMAHLGLTPQSLHSLSGYRVQGRGGDAGKKMVDDAHRLEDAGCFALVLECIPSELARIISSEITIPTIGIGAGPHCSGQVLVFHDLLGLDPSFHPHFLRRYLQGFDLIREALLRFDQDVKAGSFPAKEESYQ